VQILIEDEGAGVLAEAIASAPISLALKGAILGELLDQRLLDAGGESLFDCDGLSATEAGHYVARLRLGKRGELVLAAMRAFGAGAL